MSLYFTTSSMSDLISDGYEFDDNFTRKMLNGVSEDHYDILDAYGLAMYCTENEYEKGYKIFLFDVSGEHLDEDEDPEDDDYPLLEELNVYCASDIPEIANNILFITRQEYIRNIKEEYESKVGGDKRVLLVNPNLSADAKALISMYVSKHQEQKVLVDGELRTLAEYRMTDIVDEFEFNRIFRESLSKDDKGVILSISEDYIAI